MTVARPIAAIQGSANGDRRRGSVINMLPIMIEPPVPRHGVIPGVGAVLCPAAAGGAGHNVVVALSFGTLAAAIRRKLLHEIA